MKAYITAFGTNKVGVVAQIAGLCAKLNIGVEDMTQSILKGMFSMIMLVDIENCNVSQSEMHKAFEELTKDGDMQISVVRQEVFNAMYSI